MERLERLRLEQEAHEKAEREERMQREREERERKESEWKLAHPVLNKYTFMSYYNYETYSWQGDYCNVFFYEWSNLNIKPIHFPYSIAFFRFLDDSKIMPTDDDVNKIKLNKGSHIICRPGSTDLIIGESYDAMRSKFYAAKVLATVPESETKSNAPAVANKEDNKPKILSLAIYNVPKDYA